jgi:hypothetical protein
MKKLGKVTLKKHERWTLKKRDVERCNEEAKRMESIINVQEMKLH